MQPIILQESGGRVAGDVPDSGGHHIATGQTDDAD